MVLSLATRNCSPYVRQVVALCALTILPACNAAGPLSPSVEETLNRQIEETLRSAHGPWWGRTNGGLRLEFLVTQASDGQLRGTGTMRPAEGVPPVPIAVSGRYDRPNLSLTFTGMVYENREVIGAVAVTYTQFAGFLCPLTLTADNYERTLSLFLQEGAAPSTSLQPSFSR